MQLFACMALILLIYSPDVCSKVLLEFKTYLFTQYIHELLRMGFVYFAGLFAILWALYVAATQFYLMKQMKNDPDDEKFAFYGYLAGLKQYL